MTDARTAWPYLYRFHGVVVASQVDLPDLPPVASDAADAGHPAITISLGSQELLARLPVSAYDIVVDDHDVLDFLIPEGAVIRYSPGGRAEVAAAAGCSPALVKHVLLGQLLPNALADLGWTCLHASAVQIGGAAVALFGDGGIGKSSLAAAFLRQGHPVLCDDCTPVALESHPPLVLPGPGRLKLWPDTVQALGLRERVRRPIYDDHVKVVVDAGPITDAPVPFAGMHVLTEGPALGCMRITDPASLIPRLYQNVFGHRRRSRSAMAAHFAAVTRLALTIPLYVTTIPRDLQRLPAAVEMLVRDVGQAHVESG